MTERINVKEFRAMQGKKKEKKPERNVFAEWSEVIKNMPMKESNEPSKQVIIGICPSKSNCYKIITIGGRGSLGKTDALKKYEELFFIQCNQYRNANITGYFELYVDVYYPSQRADLDNAMKIILDCLQRVKAIPNDNKCVKIVAQKFLDKDKPRIEFTIVKA